MKITFNKNILTCDEVENGIGAWKEAFKDSDFNLERDIRDFSCGIYGGMGKRSNEYARLVAIESLEYVRSKTHYTDYVSYDGYSIDIGVTALYENDDGFVRAVFEYGDLMQNCCAENRDALRSRAYIQRFFKEVR